MIIPFKKDEITPYTPTVLDLETNDGTIIAVGFGYTDSDGVSQYRAYESFAGWYSCYLSLLNETKDEDKSTYDRLRRLYAHNGANFDFLCILNEILTFNPEHLTTCQYFVSDSAGIGCSLTAQGHRIKLLDSYRMLPQSLDKLTRTFGVTNPKQEVPSDCGKNYLLFKERYPDLFWEYLECDVKGLQQVLIAFWERIVSIYGNVGELPMTLPALALRIFTKSLTEPILTPMNINLKALERQAYNGGLTLCLRTGEVENVNVYDVNSMYPAQMHDREYPCGYQGYWTKEFNPDAVGLWRGSFKQPEEPYPPFLFDDTLKRAAYAGHGVLTTEEITYLCSLGGTFKLEDGYVYVRTGKLFADYIENAYNQRRTAQEAGDDVLATILKLLMNSLYGKFGQREECVTIKLLSGSQQKELLESGGHFQSLGQFSIVTEQNALPHVFVGIAAHVTAYARVALHKLMAEQIRHGHDVWYCDTDSVHTTGTMEESAALGAVKREFTGSAVYAGKKMYALMNEKQVKMSLKGVRRPKATDHEKDKHYQEMLCYYNDMREMALDKTKTHSYTFERAPSVRQVLGRTTQPARFIAMTRRVRNTGGIYDNRSCH